MILLATSIANSEPKEKITDIILQPGHKAPFEGVLVHEDMYRYLRAEEKRAIDVTSELIEERTRSVQAQKPSILIPASIGLLVGVVGASYVFDKTHGTDSLSSLGVGVICGGILAWTFQ